MNTASENRLFDLEFFFNLSPDLLCIAGYDGYFKKINPAVSKTLGYTNDELFARPIDFFVHSEDRNLTSRKRESIKKDTPLLDFENRYVTKSGEIVWLTWTSMPVKTEQVVFAIAKNITNRKKLEEYRRISNIMVNSAKVTSTGDEGYTKEASETKPTYFHVTDILSLADQKWLNSFETLIRKHAGKTNVNISWISVEMAIGERQLFRKIQALTGITPNKLIRAIRLQIARESIEAGKYRSVAEVSYAAGFATPSYFTKLYKEIYSQNVGELIR